MNEKLYPKAKTFAPPKTFVEEAPPVQSKEKAAPRVIVFDRNQAIEDEKKNKPKLVISAQTKAEMEAGRQALRRLQGLDE